MIIEIVSLYGSSERRARAKIVRNVWLGRELLAKEEKPAGRTAASCESRDERDGVANGRREISLQKKHKYINHGSCIK